MKKLALLSVLSCLVLLSVAQVQRKAGIANRPDSISGSTEQKKKESIDKKEMLRELNLSKEQKQKLKEFRQSAKAKKQAIENDDTLKADEKEAKLKELHKEQAKNTMGILSKEQKIKMLKMRKEKKGAKMDEMDNE